MRFWLLLCFSLMSYAAIAAEDNTDETRKKEDKWDVSFPPGERREIPLDVRSGTWMSIDVSPDGERLAFDLLGDIYSLPIAGGEARRIIGGMSFESQPKFSPDGKKIVFISDRSGAENVWIADPDGSNPKAITKGRNLEYVSPSWTPDGRIVFAHRGQGFRSVA